MKAMHGFGMSILALSVVLGLTGCGENKEGEEAKATQVAAKVGKDEITVHQLNFELARLGNLNPDQAKKAAHQVLRTLVDQDLLMQKAIENKLDRDPKVVQALESARRQLLAQAYVDQLTANVAKPTDAEIHDYYAKNPALFSERRIFRLQEISVQVTPQNTEAVKAKLAGVKNLGEFVEWLKAQNIPARGVQSVKAAEQLPLELLPRLHALKDGQALTLSSGNQLNILYLAGSQSQPVSEEQARPVIERFLLNAKKREIAEAELKKLRDATKIEYLGEYKEAASAPAAAAPAAPTEPAAGGSEQNAIQKGLEGLK